MQDVSLFSIDEVSHAEIYGFHFPCVSHDLQEIAWQALNLAIRRIADPDIKPGKVVVRENSSRSGLSLPLYGDNGSERKRYIQLTGMFGG